MSQQQRELVIREAISWNPTPFHDCARVKGVGVDCGQYLAGVFENAGIYKAIPTSAYSPQFMLHRGEEAYADELLKWCREIDESEVQAADIVLYWQGRCHSHGAIVLDWPVRIIHAVKLLGGVVYSNPQQERWLTNRRRRFFSAWNADGSRAK